MTDALLPRRAFLGRLGAVAGAGLVLPAWLAACGDDDDGGGSGGGAGESLRFENWPGYIDGETVAAFTADTGVDLTYTETLNDNNGWIEGDKGARCKIERIREVRVPAYRQTLRESGHG